MNTNWVSRNRNGLRWLASVGYIGLGFGIVYFSPALVFKGTPVPYGWLFVAIGAAMTSSCITGANLFAGGPLDKRLDEFPKDQ